MIILKCFVNIPFVFSLVLLFSGETMLETSYIRMSGPQEINLFLCTGDHCTSNLGGSPLNN